MNIGRILLLAWLVMGLGANAEGGTQTPIFDLGDMTKPAAWSGLAAGADGAVLAVPGEAVYHCSQTDADSVDWFDWYGVRFDLRLSDDRPLKLDVVLRTTRAAQDSVEDRKDATASVALQGAGWHSVMLPWSSFDFPASDNGLLRSVHELALMPRYDSGAPATVELRHPQVVRAPLVWLQSDVQGKSVTAGESAEYTVTVGNCTEQTQAVALSFLSTGFEAMAASVEPKMVQLAPGATSTLRVRVTVPQRVPPGGHETQSLRAIANGAADPTAQISFVTASRLDHPNILHTPEEWDAIRQTVKQQEWARSAADDYLQQARKWTPPKVADNGHWLYPSCYPVENGLMAEAIAYQLTFDLQYARTAHQFLLEFSDPKTGYPRTHKACNMASVQEGEFFQRIAWAYDLTLQSGLFSSSDCDQFERTLRIYLGPDPGAGGGISNWSVASLCGGLYCALALQDLHAADEILHHDGGLIDQLTQGTLDDGWWYECSISYNVWCATEFSQMAIAMRPWGVDLAHTSFPGAFRPNDQTPADQELYGMSKARWGPIEHNDMQIKRMWDALPPVLDYRGMIFGLNDSAERQVGGAAMDIAYWLYGDPAYAAVIRHGGTRDLLYGVPMLPAGGPDLSRASAYADNAGVAVLRSQTDQRPESQQIEAVLHYGDHGWFHGHFDQEDLLHISRYGLSFFNPEQIWFGYPSFLYKFYVQTSINHNMVVVDRKMQEPVPTRRLLFHSGKMMQACCVENNSRWSNPPYGGMRYYDQQTFVEKSLAEGRSVPIPANPPSYGAATDYTEPVLQRRLMIVTDDYVVLADYLKGQREHTFDSVFQMKSPQGLEAAGLKLVRHTAQWSDDPLSSAQFVTDCNWYEASAPIRGSYRFLWDADRDHPQQILNMDLRTLWPPTQELMIGQPPESRQAVQKQVEYTVRGDGKTLASGKVGTWVLGTADVDLPLDGVQSLELETSAGGMAAGGMPTLFWAGAQVVTADGKKIPLAQLPLSFQNTLEPAEQGKDYAGGPIKIAGISYPGATGAQPKDASRPAVIRVSLTGLKAVRFKGLLGGDFPVGDESQSRKIVAQRQVGTEAHYLTIIEPYQTQPAIKSALASGPETLRVELTDGRVQEIQIHNLTSSGQDISVTISESKDGKPLRTETTASTDNATTAPAAGTN